MHTAPARTEKERHLAFELLGLISRALAAALAVSLTLAALVLLLAGLAQASDTLGAPAARPIRAALMLKSGAYAHAAPLLDTDVLIQVSGPLARTRVVQTFRNPGDSWLEGVYVFPLPEQAAVDRLRMRIGERVIEGEIHEREAARAAYDQARSAGKQASLVEQQRPNMFTTRVASIAPHAEIRIEIEYQQTLTWEQADNSGRYSLRFPMVVGPRYIPGTPLHTPPEPGDGWAPDTDRVADASHITPPVAHSDAGPVNPLKLRIELDAGAPIASVRSHHHPIRTDTPSPNTRNITLADGAIFADRDFELSWTLAAGTAPSAVLFADPGRERTHALLMLMPPAMAPDTARLPREVVFVVDTSGSMLGTSIEQAREALALALQRLPAGDRFNVIEFNSASRALFDSARPASPTNIVEAVAWVRALEAEGGTEMVPALARALDGSSDAARVRQVIFLTDGAVGNEDELFGLIQRQLGDTRLFTIGIGSAPNSHFMRKAAQSGRGTFTYIGNLDDVQARMSELFAKLEAPVLKGVTVRWSDNPDVDMTPRHIPDLYLGEPVLVSAALAHASGDVEISGSSGAVQWATRVSLADANHGHGVGVLWARNKIAALLDTLHDGANEDEIRAAVVAIALEHHLVSKYTSLVAVDKTPARPAQDELKSAAVPTNLPAGWDADAVFGELPRGATDARWNLLVGILALLLGGLLWLGQRRHPGVRAQGC